jgi:hypothetical protein
MYQYHNPKKAFKDVYSRKVLMPSSMQMPTAGARICFLSVRAESLPIPGIELVLLSR